MIVNPDMDGHTKTHNNLKIFQTTQKTLPTENQKNSKKNTN